MQDTSDTIKIVTKKFHLQQDQLYKQKKSDKLWQFKSIDATKAHFEHQPLFQGPAEKLEVDHSDLKDFKMYQGKVPKLLSPDELKPLLPQNNQALALAVEHAQAQTYLLENYQQYLGSKSKKC